MLFANIAVGCGCDLQITSGQHTLGIYVYNNATYVAVINDPWRFPENTLSYDFLRYPPFGSPFNDQDYFRIVDESFNRSGTPPPLKGFLYFRHGSSKYANAIVVPNWLIPFGIAFGLRFYDIWRAAQKARSKGLCAKCGYDLRATPNRCPECGTIAVRAVDSP
jgi:hypothetical protein